MRETEHKNIDGTNYVCLMMPATVAQKTLVRLTDTLGRPLVFALSKALGDEEIEVEHLADVALRALFDKLNEETSDDIIKSLLDGVEAEGVGSVSSPAVFDSHFRGRVLHLYKVVAWSVEVNYRDFFDAAATKKLKQSLQTVLTRASTPPTSTQPSGPSATLKDE